MSKKRNPISDIIDSKEIKLKGPSTIPDPVDNTLDFDNVKYKKPESLEEQAVKAVGNASTAGMDIHLTGSTIFNTEKLRKVIQPVDIARAIPDPYEREAYIRKNGQKLVNLTDLNTFGIHFENDFKDLIKYKEKNYHKSIKNFVDDLDENEGWITELGKTTGKLIGKTAWNVLGILPAIYGVGSAIINLDPAKLFNNSAFDAWEYVDRSIDKYTFIYGGSNIWEIDPVTGGIKYDEFGQPVKKDFFTRVGSDPVKIFNDEMAPAISFVAGAVVTELLATAAAPFTGGASVAANTAKLEAQAVRAFGKSYRVLKGLDKLDDAAKATQAKAYYAKFFQTNSTIMSALRSSSLENSLIGRSTSDRVYNELISQHEGPLTEQQEKLYRAKADEAGFMAYTINLPLVAGSNFIQFPKLYLKNWNTAINGARKNYKYLDPKSFSGTRFVNGKRVANVDASEFGIQKYFGYTKAATKGFISEGFEEFAQGALEEGLLDYYGHMYGAQNTEEQVYFINSLVGAARKFANSDEGVSSISIGAAMGLLGLKLPVIKQNAKGKYRLKLQSFGGAGSEIRELRSQSREARAFASKMNTLQQKENPVLAKNFQSHFTRTEAQKNADAAAVNNDVFEFKNSEHQQMFDLIYNRAELGIVDSIFQDIENAKKLPLAKFNEVYGSKEFQFTEAQRKKALEKAESSAAKIVEEIDNVKLLMENHPDTVVEKIQRFITNLYKDTNNQVTARITPKEYQDGLVKQLAYLRSTIDNTEIRESEILENIEKTSKGGSVFGTGASIGIDLSSLDGMAVELAGINDKTGRAEFKETINKKIDEILAEFKKSDPIRYSLMSPTLKQSIQDIKDLKIRKAQAAKLYENLFTAKGQKELAKFTATLKAVHSQKMAEAMVDLLKDQVKNTKNTKVNTSVEEADALFGNSDALDPIVHLNIIKGINEYEKIKPGDLGNLSNNDIRELIRFLDKYPSLLSAVVNSLKAKGVDVPGIKSVDDLIQLTEIDESIHYKILNSIEEVLAKIKQLEKISFNRPIFEDSEDEYQPAVEGASPEVDYSRVAEIFEDTDSDEVFITMIYDKKVTKSGYEFDESGKPKDHPLKEKEFDSAIVNSPEFLSNKDLRTNIREATFEIPDTEYNRESTTDVSNMDIRAYYTDEATGKKIFIGKLPTAKGAGNLLALRQAILNEHNMRAVKKGTEINVKEIEDQIRELEKQLTDLEKQTETEEDKMLSDLKNILKEEKSVTLTPEEIDALTMEETGELIKKLCK